MFGPMTATPIVRLDAGTNLDVAVAELLAIADYPEISRWIQFPTGVMLFLLVPGDPQSGAFYVYDRLKTGEFGNAIRAPLGIHRGAGRRYWFYGADYNLEEQMAYLKRLPKVSSNQLQTLIAGKALPPPLAGRGFTEDSAARRSPAKGSREFRILEHIGTKVRKAGRNYVTQCPSCAQAGHDRSGDNLAISIKEPRKYLCWAGCTREMIRAALGCPVRVMRSA